MKKRIHNRRELEQFRKKLRKNFTPAEAFLWRHLKAKKLKGRRFNRQHSIKNYIVDFYCASEKLAIELDGAVHNSPQAQEYDAKRTKVLNEWDIPLYDLIIKWYLKTWNPYCQKSQNISHTLKKGDNRGITSFQEHQYPTNGMQIGLPHPLFWTIAP